MKLSEQELEQKVEELTKRNNESKRNIFDSEEERWEFIRRCERVYQKDSESFVKEFEEREYEGNVDERKWYRLYRTLTEKNNNKNS